MTSDRDVPELTENELARWSVIQTTIAAMSQSLAAGTLDSEGLAASIAQLGQVEVDHQRYRDSLHVPEDAGDWSAALELVLRRIPDNWGRWLSCDSGWYPLIAGLDVALTAIDPDYVVHQVKEKFGTLRFYAEPSVEGELTRKTFAELIRRAELRSASICERCGMPGELSVTAKRQRWYKTLCPACTAAIAAESGRVFQPARTSKDDV